MIICSHLPNTTPTPALALQPPPTLHPPPSPPICPLHWCSLHGYWPLICFRSLALFLYDLLSFCELRRSSCSTCLQILICAASSAVIKGGAPRIGMEKNMQRMMGSKDKHRGEVWWVFQFWWDIKEHRRQGLEKKCSELSETWHSEDLHWSKTESLINYFVIQKKQSQFLFFSFFLRPCQNDDHWIIHNVFISRTWQMCSSIFHERKRCCWKMPQPKTEGLAAALLV